jgi:hypothetical protein
MERYISITHMSRRTQITLSDSQYDLLRYEAYRSGLSLAELVRRAVDLTYRPGKRPKVRGYEINVGLWRQPDVAVVGRIEPYRGRSPIERQERIDAAMQTRPQPARRRRRARPPPT